MLFNSIHFFFFFIIVTALYFAIPYRSRWFMLLVASCYFYMAFVPVYILILAFTIVVDYIAGILIENAQGKKRKMWLIMSLVANIGILAVFKYYNFFNQNLTMVLGWMHVSNPIPFLEILLPIGLSFHTFQAMSYTIEVYRGNQTAERHFGIYSLYVMFYPQLVAGPIERPQNLLWQFRSRFDFDYNRVISGLHLMAWGLFKKVVIADRLAVGADAVFEHPYDHGSAALLIGTLFFTFQIFCDFSGYSDMAIGAARVMGFKLMTNFNRPYQARSIDEFWKRWHISLSTWFKDYLYIPLGGNRVAVPRWYANLFIVFLVSGFWHGAKWTFVIWGALHGSYLVFGLITRKWRKKLTESMPFLGATWLSRLSTFALVCFAWVFFRANDGTSAMYIARKLLTGWKEQLQKGLSFNSIQNLCGSAYQFWLSCAGILFLFLVHQAQEKSDLSKWFTGKSVWFRWSVYYLAIICIIFLGVFQHRKFIYFQF